MPSLYGHEGASGTKKKSRSVFWRRDAIPNDLSFERIVNDEAIFPCRAIDFMNYLRFVERTAENLKFYLWFQDYSRRFYALSEKEQRMSPLWTDDLPTAHANQVLDITGAENSELKAGTIPEVDVIGPDQPLRSEAVQISTIYLYAGSPLELNLSHRDRSNILRRIAYTTHPTAFQPALFAVERFLRIQSHPNFVRRQLANMNAERRLALRVFGTLLLFLLGPVCAALLVLSDNHRAWRIFPAFMIGIGFFCIMGVRRGICMCLVARAERNLEPWEHITLDDGDEENRHESVDISKVSFKLQDEEEERRRGEENIERCRKQSYFTKAWEGGIKVRDPVVRRFQLLMAAQNILQALLVCSATLIVLLPLPIYGMI